MAKYFNANLKFIRQKKGVSQQELASKIGAERSSISRWENGEIDTPLEMAMKIAEVLDVPYYDFFGRDLRFDNAIPVDIGENVVKIPVLGVIKAGIPIEAQEDIIEYIEIPKSWTRGGKKFYGLKISGDSMTPKYQENDTVVFEDSREYDLDSMNKKDCAVMVNGDDATFKKISVSNEGITLIPYNTNDYDIVTYSNKEIDEKPVKVIGIAREKRTEL